MKKLSLVAIALCLLSACSKKTVDPPIGICGVTTLPLDSNGYFAFGLKYGFCASECATFFEIKNGQIYPDSMSRFTGKLYFQTKALPAAQYDRARNLLSNIPATLRDHPDTVLGCPDCHDQGGYYIEYKANAAAAMQYWHIDTDTDSLESSVKYYVESMAQIIDSLR